MSSKRKAKIKKIEDLGDKVSDGATLYLPCPKKIPNEDEMTNFC